MFFFECFQLKYSRNFVGSKYDLTMVTFNSSTNTKSVLGCPKFLSVSGFTFWKMMCFEKWIAFFGAKSRCFQPGSRSPAEAMRYADETLSFQDSAIQATQ